MYSGGERSSIAITDPGVELPIPEDNENADSNPNYFQKSCDMEKKVPPLRKKILDRIENQLKEEQNRSKNILI